MKKAYIIKGVKEFEVINIEYGWITTEDGITIGHIDKDYDNSKEDILVGIKNILLEKAEVMPFSYVDSYSRNLPVMGWGVDYLYVFWSRAHKYLTNKEMRLFKQIAKYANDDARFSFSSSLFGMMMDLKRSIRERYFGHITIEDYYDGTFDFEKLNVTREQCCNYSTNQEYEVFKLTLHGYIDKEYLVGRAIGYGFHIVCMYGDRYNLNGVHSDNENLLIEDLVKRLLR